MCEELKNKIFSFNKYISNQTEDEIMQEYWRDIKQVIENQQLELEKKDKIINELEDIFYNYQLCEYELTDCTYRKCEYIVDDEIPPCKECIKQYYERKVENGN